MSRTKRTQTTALTKWDDELAKAAEIAAGMEESSGGGQFFTTRGGQLSWQGAPLPGNEMAVIILDHIFETVYYADRYDPDNPQGPTAFAFGRSEKELRWHENSDLEFAGKLCTESEVCEWGSADTGRGKAARETRRIAMIPAGRFERNGDFELFDDEDHYASTTVGFMRLPVTSVKGFANFVKQVAGAMKRPPFGIITRVAVMPDSKTQFKVVFEALEKVPDELMGVIMERRKEVMATIDFPYQRGEEEPGARSTKPAGRRSRKY